ncbi:helix-turn-helix domain-containing protein [Rhodococcus pyridinivorans]|uniref:helix-turn-helix domain-containing protein n=1 Tax=Rhodococcus pyridinivorans TaxID=103816 RepID=UPI002078A65A|nr:helix-turn-helix domain-containing protein [Rhodococcus pyridinivorans]USI88763.1 helix-turn-helix domain-containing protein [Rhodococcus pyridinivorans]
MSVQRLDGVVLLTGQSIEAARFAVRVTIAARQRNGQRVPPEITELARELSVFGHRDTHDAIGNNTGTQADWISTQEVARMLGCSHRQARRLAPELGGTLHAGRWLIDRTAVTNYRKKAA